MAKRTKRRPGPKPDHLALKGPWAEQVKRAFTKKRPKRGWPKHDKRKK